MRSTRPQFARAFTLMELMVSVLVLVAVMIAVGSIFSSARQITSAGQATAETLQQGLAIEQQLREDIARMSPEGFVAIRCVAIPNNYRGDHLLIDPSLDATAIIRCDQLIFFTEGLASPMVFGGGSGTTFAGQGVCSMVYYGHGVHFPALEGMRDVDGDGAAAESDDAALVIADTDWVVAPWYQGPIDIETRRYPDSQATRFEIVPEGGGTANGTQGYPADWVLCRQAITLADDDQQNPDATNKTVYMGVGMSSNSVFPWDPRVAAFDSALATPHVINGRVDIAATQLDDVRQSVLQVVEPGGGGEARAWRGDTSTDIDQQELIASLMRWPRVEPYPLTSDRADQSLMMPALVGGCASFQIEWCYEDGLGETVDANYNRYPGFEFADDFPRPWWGGASHVDPDDAYSAIVFDTLTAFVANANGDPYDTSDDADTDVAAYALVDPSIIEPFFDPLEGPSLAPVPAVGDGAITEYWAVFGYNSTDPFREGRMDLLNDEETDAGDGIDFGGQPGDAAWRYTPRPSALRITVRIQDSDGRLGAGWTYQFVVDIPEHGR